MIPPLILRPISHTLVLSLKIVSHTRFQVGSWRIRLRRCFAAWKVVICTSRLRYKRFSFYRCCRNNIRMGLFAACTGSPSVTIGFGRVQSPPVQRQGKDGTISSVSLSALLFGQIQIQILTSFRFRHWRHWSRNCPSMRATSVSSNATL